MENPRLIEHQAGHFMYDTLRQCHEKRILTYSFVFNITIVCVFCLITGIILYLLYRKKKTPDQRRSDIIRDQKMVLEKIKSLKEQKQYYLENESITKMPMPDIHRNTHANLFY